MFARSKQGSRGFVLLEALIALLIVSLGALAIAKLESLTLSAAGEARARSEAMAIAQRKMEELRNVVLVSQMPAAETSSCVYGDANCPVSSPVTATYTLTWTYTAGTYGIQISLTTSWTDRFGTTQSLALNSRVAWDSPLNQAKAASGFKGISAPSPSGDAKRGDYSLRKDNNGNVLGNPPSGTNPGNVHIYHNTGNDRTELLNAAGQVVLYLNGSTSNFTAISGRVYFDMNAGNNQLPDADFVRVRLSSEGECFYNNVTHGGGANSDLTTTINRGSNDYTFFDYQCFVGNQWWGNVGIKIDDKDSQGQNLPTPNICAGSPTFNGGTNNGTLTSANSMEAGVRTYRGFTGTFENNQNRFCTGCLSTGVKGGITIPNAGAVTPGEYTSASPANSQYKQHFLLTVVDQNQNGQNSESCQTKMDSTEFANNAGKYYCISPDSDAAHNDICPGVWPNFEDIVGNGGTLNYTLTVTPTANGTVTSDDNAINCGASCSTSYPSGTIANLTATPAAGFSVSWSGCTTSSGNNCSVNMLGTTTVTPTFSLAPSYNTLTVQTSGSGSVTSADTFIDCPTDPTKCSYSYTSSSSVSLIATPGSGYSFSGWTNCPTANGNTCTVPSMSAALTVGATFAQTVTLTVSQGTSTGSGSVTGSTISCNVAAPGNGNGTSTTSGTCSASYTVPGPTVVLTATPAASNQFVKWTGCDSVGNGSNYVDCTVSMSSSKNVVAWFFPSPCNTTISGQIHSGYTSSVACSPANNCQSCSITTGTGTYACTLKNTQVAPGASATLVNSGASASVSMSVTATCQAQTNVNFP